MKIIMVESEMIDSIAVFGAREHRIPIEELTVELFFEEGKGFYSHLYRDGSNTTYLVSQQQMIDSVASFLHDYHRFDPNRMEIELFYEEAKGFFAGIDTAK
jgi:hypothetical protein